MDWKDLKNEEPRELHTVLVALNLNDDSWLNFITANYFAPENQWIIHHDFRESSDNPYIKIVINCQESDKWAYFEWPEEGE